MKTIFSSILLLGVSSGCLAAPEHRISLGAGALSYSHIRETIDEITDYELAPPYFGEKPIVGQSIDGFAWRNLENFPITVNLHYECTLGKRFGVGVCFGYEHHEMSLDIDKWTYIGAPTDVQQYAYHNYKTTHETGSLDRHIFFITPEATLYYFKKEHVAMYGKIAAGVKFYTIKKKNVEDEIGGETHFEKHPFAFQVSPICFEFGNEKIRGFMEYGFGHQGLAQFGVKYTLKKQESE